MREAPPPKRPHHAFGRHLRALNERYLGPEGDTLALEELAPVARRFAGPGARLLEVGCGYGRNLVALSTLPANLLVGCDVAHGELVKARARVAARPGGATPSLVRQPPDRLPFRDGVFDLVVLWQVLEHVIGGDAKRALIAECVRVLRPGGHLLVETPNQWFPVDYHDNKLPFVHWVLPFAAREWLTWKVRGERYHPSEYMSLPSLERLLRNMPGVTRIARATRVYFAAGYAEAWRTLGGTQLGMKRAIFVALAPVHALLTPFGASVDLFLPSIRVVWKVEKQPF
ncbi:MAG TPA: methyltransferase domain-containing protein [Dongiaceae bacterium]|nr:methyltransferase domain-containing protein [Dongiaceae bacterium]